MSEQEKVEEFNFEWKSTAEERYDTGMVDTAKKLIVATGGVVVDEWGGTSFGEVVDGLRSDNGIRAAMTLAQAADVAGAISIYTRHPVKVTAPVESA